MLYLLNSMMVLCTLHCGCLSVCVCFTHVLHIHVVIVLLINEGHPLQSSRREDFGERVTD